MNSGKKVKIFILFVTLISSSFLMGLGFDKPSLRNDNLPFIDLSGSIGNSLINAEKAEDISVAVTIVEPHQEVTVSPHTNDEIIIRVRDKEISIITIRNEKDTVVYQYSGLDEFKRDITNTNDKFTDKTIILIDDYAESTTFRTIISLFNDVLMITPQIETRT